MTLMLSSFANGVDPPARLSACSTVSYGFMTNMPGLFTCPITYTRLPAKVLDDDRDNGLRDVFLELALDVDAHFVGGAARGLDLAGQRK